MEKNDLSNLTQPQNTIEPKKEKYKIILYNILGAVVGLLSFYGIYYLTTFIFSLLLRVPFISTILSWPFGPEVYAVGTIILVSTFGSLAICNKICKPSIKGKKIGVIVFCILLIILGINILINFIFAYGLSVILIPCLAPPVIGVISLINAFKGNDIMENM